MVETKDKTFYQILVRYKSHSHVLIHGIKKNTGKSFYLFYVQGAIHSNDGYEEGHHS